MFKTQGWNPSTTNNNKMKTQNTENHPLSFSLLVTNSVWQAWWCRVYCVIRRLARLPTPFWLFFLLSTCGLSPNSNRGPWAGELWAVSSIALLSPTSTLSRQALAWSEVKLWVGKEDHRLLEEMPPSLPCPYWDWGQIYSLLCPSPVMISLREWNLLPVASQCPWLPLWNNKLKQ